MGVATGCGCKEVYRFPHTTYPYSSCICPFLQQHPYFLFIYILVIRSGPGGPPVNTQWKKRRQHATCKHNRLIEVQRAC